MDMSKTIMMVKEELRQHVASLTRAIEHCETAEELNICVQSGRQVIQHAAALLGPAVIEEQKKKTGE